MGDDSRAQRYRQDSQRRRERSPPRAQQYPPDQRFPEKRMRPETWQRLEPRRQEAPPTFFPQAPPGGGHVPGGPPPGGGFDRGWGGPPPPPHWGGPPPPPQHRGGPPPHGGMDHFSPAPRHPEGHGGPGGRGGSRGGSGTGMGRAGGPGRGGGGGRSSGRRGATVRPKYSPIPGHDVPLPFKRWLGDQAESIGSDEALLQYADYEKAFMAGVARTFFEAHKEEEWLREKYHPAYDAARISEKAEKVTRRLGIYLALRGQGLFEGVTLTKSNSKRVMQMMEAVNQAMDAAVGPDSVVGGETIATPAGWDVQVTREDPPAPEKTMAFTAPVDVVDATSTASSTDDAAAAAVTIEAAAADADAASATTSAVPEAGASADAADLEDGEIVLDFEEAEEEHGGVGEAQNKTGVTTANTKHTRVSQQTLYCGRIPATLRKRDLRDCLRSVPGFDRLAMSEPGEPKPQRIAWATFKAAPTLPKVVVVQHGSEEPLRFLPARSDIKTLRIVHTLPVEADLEQLLALVRQLDEEADLWQEGERNPLLMQPPRDEEADDSGTEERASAAQAAEGELSGDEEGEVKSDAGEEEGEVVAAAKPAETPGASIGKDVKESPTAVWESQLALYLRIVHSYDFYTAKDAPIEDGMATRCGGIAVRRDTKDPPRIIETRWRSKNAERLTMPVLDDAAVASFGAALSAESAAEMFIAANTKQLKEDRFQCVLPPGKVFKTAEFVAKHIVNKHAKALEAAKIESSYFASYVRDPRRPMQLAPPPAVARVAPAPAPPQRSPVMGVHDGSPGAYPLPGGRPPYNPGMFAGPPPGHFGPLMGGPQMRPGALPPPMRRDPPPFGRDPLAAPVRDTRFPLHQQQPRGPPDGRTVTEYTHDPVAVPDYL